MIGPTKTPQPSGIGSIPSISDAPPQSDSPGVGCKDTFPFLALVFAVASGGGGVEEVAGFFFGLSQLEELQGIKDGVNINVWLPPNMSTPNIQPDMYPILYTYYLTYLAMYIGWHCAQSDSCRLMKLT